MACEIEKTNKISNDELTDVNGRTNMAGAVSGCVLRMDICTRIRSQSPVPTVVHVLIEEERKNYGYMNDRTLEDV